MHSSNNSSALLESSDLSAEVEKGRGLYSTHCASCHGPFDTSVKLGRNETQIQMAIGNISQMSHLSGLGVSQIRAISRALVYQANGGGVVEGEDRRLKFACNPNVRSLSSIQKLNNREFRNSLNAVLDTIDTNFKNDSQLVELLNRLPSDLVLEADHTRKEQSFFISQNLVVALFDASYRAAGLIANSTALNQFPNTNGCLSQATVSQSCHQTFVREFGSLAFRRPLSTSEAVTVANRFWDSSLSKVNQLQMTVTGLLQSPDFLYKVYDRGPAVPGIADALQMTSYELAAKLSYFLTGAPPDATLRSLAASGDLLEDAVLTQQIDRLLSTTRSREILARLFRESYGYDIFGNFAYPTFYLEGINMSGLQSAFIDELDQYFASEVVTHNSSFHQLLTSRRSQISNASLAQIYGVSTGAVTLPAERSGFLNRAAMLTKRSGLRASPIKRGLVVLENVLCSTVGLPPANAPTALPDMGNELLSTRDMTHRVTEASGSSCIACHGRINSLGYAFESFDTLGRLRSVESVYDASNNLRGQVPVNTRASTQELSSNVITYTDSADLADEIGKSDKAMLCFAKHLKSFESRRPAQSTDHCHMNEVIDTMYGTAQSQGSIRSAIRKFILSEQFKQWNF